MYFTNTKHVSRDKSDIQGTGLEGWLMHFEALEIWDGLQDKSGIQTDERESGIRGPGGRTGTEVVRPVAYCGNGQEKVCVTVEFWAEEREIKWRKL